MAGDRVERSDQPHELCDLRLPKAVRLLAGESSQAHARRPLQGSCRRLERAQGKSRARCRQAAPAWALGDDGTLRMSYGRRVRPARNGGYELRLAAEERTLLTVLPGTWSRCSKMSARPLRRPARCPAAVAPPAYRRPRRRACLRVDDPPGSPRTSPRVARDDVGHGKATRLDDDSSFVACGTERPPSRPGIDDRGPEDETEPPASESIRPSGSHTCTWVVSKRGRRHPRANPARPGAGRRRPRPGGSLGRAAGWASLGRHSTAGIPVTERLGMPRLLAIMGSGETSPTMVKVHRQLLERLGPPPVPAVLLDTPFGFQENAREIAGRAVNYFRESLQATIAVTGLAAAGHVTRTASGRWPSPTSSS